MNTEARFFAAVIAAQNRDYAQSASGRYKRALSAHQKPPGERPIMLNL
jgi:hypothetical protein